MPLVSVASLHEYVVASIRVKLECIYISFRCVYRVGDFYFLDS